MMTRPRRPAAPRRRSRRARLVTTLVATAVAAGLAGGLSAQQPDTAALARELPRLMEVGDVPGLSIAVLDEGPVVWTGAFGTLGDGEGTAVDRETVFSAASLSKPIFAYVVLRLAERGAIDLDRPLAELLDDPRVTHDERGRRITPRCSPTAPSPRSIKETFDPPTDYTYLFMQEK